MSNLSLSQREIFILTASGTQGVVLLFANLLLVATIAYHKALRLRKEFVILGAAAAVDCLFGGTLLWGSLSKAHQYFSGVTTFHRWQCLLKGHAIVYLFTVSVQGQYLLLRSVDRLIAVGKPIKYLTFERSYACRLMLFPFLPASVMTVWYFISAWSDTELLQWLYCTLRLTVLDKHRIVWTSLHALFGMVSVLLYIPVYIIYNRSHQVGPTGGQNVEHSRQRKLTVSIGFGALGTFVLFILPAFVSMTAVRALGKYMFLFYNCNALTNLTIFTKRHVEIREGLVKLFKCDQLPANIDVVRNNAKYSRKTTRMNTRRQSHDQHAM